MPRAVVVASSFVAALAGSIASADQRVSPADLSAMFDLEGRVQQRLDITNRTVPATSFTVLTGLGNASNQFLLIEPTAPPIRDDVVALGSTNEQINDYRSDVAPALVGQRRFVTSSVGAGNYPDQDLITVMIAGRDAAGSPVDLWPGGLTSGGQTITRGSLGLGLNLPAALGGNVPMSIAPQNFVVAATVEVVTDGVSSGQISLPLAFFAPSNAAWGGALGIIFNGINGVQSDFTIRILVAPSPSAGGLLALAGLVAMRRRRTV